MKLRLKILTIVMLLQGLAQQTSCPLQLLQALQLQSVQSKEEAEDSLICEGVKAENNCCSPIDEIKILKNYTQFTTPKIKNFQNQITLNYEKILSFDSYIRSLKPDSINFHYAQYGWIKKQSQKDCINKKFFIKDADLEDLIREEKNTENWVDDWIQRVLRNVLVDFLKIVIKNDLMTREDFENFIQKKVISDKTVIDELKSMRDDINYSKKIKAIASKIYEILLAVPEKKFNYKQKDKNTNKENYLQSLFQIQESLQNYTKNDLDKKILKEINLSAQKINSKTILDYLKESKNQKEFFSGTALKEDVYKGIMAELVKQLEKDTEFLYATQFIYYPEIFKTSDKNYHSTKKISNQVLKILQEIINKMKFEDNIDEIDLFTTVSSNYLKLFNLKYMVDSYLPQLIQKELILNGWQQILNDVQKQKIKKLNKKEKNDFKETLDLLYNDLIKEDFNSIVIKVSQYYNVYRQQNFIADWVLNRWNNVKAKLGKNSINYNVQKMRNFTRSGIKEFEQKIKENIFLDNDKNDEVCASFTRHQLVKQFNFNKKKLWHCAYAQRQFENFDFQNMLQTFGEIKEDLSKLMEVKKSVYCTVCDSTKNSFIDLNAKEFKTTKDFCVQLFDQNRNYLIWKNKIFEEYLYKVHQYLQCYQGDASQSDYPYDYYGQSQYERSVQIDFCLKSTIDQIEPCLKLCNQFSLFSTSEFWEGEIERLQNIYVNILKGIRISGFQFSKEIMQRDLSVKEIHTNIPIQEIYQLTKDEEQLVNEMFGNKKSDLNYRSTLSTTETKTKGRLLAEKQRIDLKNFDFIGIFQKKQRKQRKLKKVRIQRLKREQENERLRNKRLIKERLNKMVSRKLNKEQGKQKEQDETKKLNKVKEYKEFKKKNEEQRQQKYSDLKTYNDKIEEQMIKEKSEAMKQMRIEQEYQKMKKYFDEQDQKKQDQDKKTLAQFLKSEKKKESTSPAQTPVVDFRQVFVKIKTIFNSTEITYSRDDISKIDEIGFPTPSFTKAESFGSVSQMKIQFYDEGINFYNRLLQTNINEGVINNLKNQKEEDSTEEYTLDKAAISEYTKISNQEVQGFNQYITLTLSEEIPVAQESRKLSKKKKVKKIKVQKDSLLNGFIKMLIF